MDEENFALRKAVRGDMQFLFDLRNEESVRLASFDSGPIKMETHKIWFEKKLNEGNCVILIAESDGRPVGMARFDFDGSGKVVSSIAVKESERKKGYGTRILEIGCKYVYDNFGIKKIFAYVKKGNESSSRTFEKAGFSASGTAEIKGFDSIEMAKSME